MYLSVVLSRLLLEEEISSSQRFQISRNAEGVGAMRLGQAKSNALVGSSSKTPVTKPDGTKMFRSVFLNDARRCCFFTNIIVKYYYDHIHNLVILWKSCSMAN